ncbi:hypothetical protein GCM10010428_49340 [Actinosynnema pretiosum subsp. pretiosum]
MGGRFPTRFPTARLPSAQSREAVLSMTTIRRARRRRPTRPAPRAVRPSTCAGWTAFLRSDRSPLATWAGIARVVVLVAVLAGLLLAAVALVPARTTVEIGPVRIARTHLA